MARMAPCVTEGGVGQDALEVVAVLIAATGREEGVGLDALEDDVAREGQKEYRHVERDVEPRLEGGEVVVEALAAFAEDEFRQLKENGTLDFQQLGTSKDVLVLVFDGCLDTEVATGEEVVVAAAVVGAQWRGIGELDGEAYLLLGGPNEFYVCVDKRQRVG